MLKMDLQKPPPEPFGQQAPEMLKMSLRRPPESHLASRPLEGVLGGADFMRIYAGLAIFA